MDPTSRNDLIDEILALSQPPASDHESMRTAYQCCETHELRGLRDWLRVQHRNGTFKPQRRIGSQAVKRERMMRDFNSLEVQGHA